MCPATVSGIVIGDAPVSYWSLKKTRRKLGRVNFCKGFWDGYWGQGKNWPIADRRVPSNDPRSLCERLLGPVSFSFLVANVANALEKASFICWF